MKRTSGLSLLSLAAIVALGASRADAGYVETVMADNPIGYWRLEETGPASGSRNFIQIFNSGSATLTSNSGFYDMSLSAGSNAGANGPRAPEFPGMPADNKAPHLQASPTPVDIVFNGAVGDFNLTTEFSAEGWFYQDEAGTIDTVVSKYASSGTRRSWVFQVDAAGKLKMTMSTDGSFAGATEFLGDATLEAETWNYVAFSYDGPAGELKFYINGELDAEFDSGVPAAVHNNSTDGIRIGYHTVSSDPIDGLVDEVAFYGSALGGETFAAHYNAAVVPEPSTIALMLVACFGAVAMRRRRA